MDLSVVFVILIVFGVVLGVIGDRLGLFRFLDEPVPVKRRRVEADDEDSFDQRPRPAEPVVVPGANRGKPRGPRSRL